MKNHSWHWIWIPMFLAIGGFVGCIFGADYQSHEGKLKEISLIVFPFFIMNMTLSPSISRFHSIFFVIGQLCSFSLYQYPKPSLLGFMVVFATAISAIWAIRKMRPLFAWYDQNDLEL